MASDYTRALISLKKAGYSEAEIQAIRQQGSRAVIDAAPSSREIYGVGSSGETRETVTESRPSLTDGGKETPPSSINQAYAPGSGEYDYRNLPRTTTTAEKLRIGQRGYMYEIPAVEQKQTQRENIPTPSLVPIENVTATSRGYRATQTTEQGTFIYESDTRGNINVFKEDKGMVTPLQLSTGPGLENKTKPQQVAIKSFRERTTETIKAAPSFVAGKLLPSVGKVISGTPGLLVQQTKYKGAQYGVNPKVFRYRDTEYARQFYKGLAAPVKSFGVGVVKFFYNAPRLPEKTKKELISSFGKKESKSDKYFIQSEVFKNNIFVVPKSKKYEYASGIKIKDETPFFMEENFRVEGPLIFDKDVQTVGTVGAFAVGGLYAPKIAITAGTVLSGLSLKSTLPKFESSPTGGNLANVAIDTSGTLLSGLGLYKPVRTLVRKLAPYEEPTTIFDPDALAGKVKLPKTTSIQASLKDFRSQKVYSGREVSGYKRVVIKETTTKPKDYLVATDTLIALEQPVKTYRTSNKYRVASAGPQQYPYTEVQAFPESPGALGIEPEGLYTTPANRVSPNFLRVDGGEYKSGLSLLPSFNDPTITRITVRGIERIPKEVLLQKGYAESNIYMKQQAKRGVAIIDKRSEAAFDPLVRATVGKENKVRGGTSEIESIVPVSTRIKFKVSGVVSKFLGISARTKYKGEQVSIKDYDVRFGRPASKTTGKSISSILPKQNKTVTVAEVIKQDYSSSYFNKPRRQVPLPSSSLASSRSSSSRLMSSSVGVSSSRSLSSSSRGTSYNYKEVSSPMKPYGVSSSGLSPGRSRTTRSTRSGYSSTAQYSYSSPSYGYSHLPVTITTQEKKKDKFKRKLEMEPVEDKKKKQKKQKLKYKPSAVANFFNIRAKKGIRKATLSGLEVRGVV